MHVPCWNGSHPHFCKCLAVGDCQAPIEHGLHALTPTAVGQPDAEVLWTLPARVQGAGLISASHEDGIDVMQNMAQ